MMCLQNNDRRLLVFLPFLVAVVFPWAGPLNAADVTGTITGLVKDASGAVIAGAVVEGVEVGTNAAFKAATDETGTYSLRAIPVGVYNLSAELGGFKRFETKGVRVQVNETVRVDLALEVGETRETVTVTADVVILDTATATLKAVVDEKRIQELPLNGRNPTQLMQLIVGVQADPRANVTSGTTYPGVQPVSVNGGRANTTNYILDGGQNNDHYSNAPNPMPNPDALQEFSVQTNSFSAEFGRNLGGVVNAVTKSGTNELHGSAFEYLRNSALNAANFFAPIRDGEKVSDGLKRNQFGATLGGPVSLGSLYNGKDKTFFFFSYQGTRNRQAPTSVSQIVPTAAQRRGDFSALTRQLRNPFTGGAYANNQIPLSDFNPVTRSLVENNLPVPAGNGNTISYAVRSDLRDDQWMVRGDHQISSRNRLSGRFWISDASQPAVLDPANYLAQAFGRTWRNTSVVISDAHTFSPTLINNVIFGFNRTNGFNYQEYPEKSVAELGAKIYNDDKPQIDMNVAGYFRINTGDTNQFLRDEYQVSDSLRWTRGRHQMSFGGEYGRGVGDIINNFRANGVWAFNGSAPFTGDALADFFVGRFQTLTQGVGEYKSNRFTILSLFAQDSIKLTRRLTLDLGLRWEPFLPYSDVDGKFAAWRPGEQSTRYINAPRGVVYPGDAGIADGGFDTVWRNFGPRFGVAWDVTGDGKTSLRTGYGVFFDRPNTIATNAQANQAPFGTVVIINGNATNSVLDPYAGVINPFPGTTTPPREVSFFLPHTAYLYEQHMRNAYLQSWNLTLEREVAGGMVARASYAGSKSTRLQNLREINPAVYAPGATTATTNQRRPFFPALGQVTLVEPTSNATFHALQLSGEKRFSGGFSVLTNYMWSKSIDDGSGNKEGPARTNPFDQRFDKGLTDFDHAHVFNFSSLWELPLRLENAVGRFILEGWNVTSIVSLRSGFPFTVASGVDNARSGTGSQRADVIGNPFLPDGRTRQEQVNQWLNVTAFAPNALGTYGNQGRNVFRGPGFATVDLGLHKNFRIAERLTTQFRFETFNAFNRVNLQGPNASQNAGNFMRTTTAYDPRILQFALRLLW